MHEVCVKSRIEKFQKVNARLSVLKKNNNRRMISSKNDAGIIDVAKIDSI